MTKRIKWTDGMLFEAAAKFETRDEFASENTKAYAAALRRGLLPQICAHMEFKYTIWTDEMVFAIAMEFNSRHSFEKGNSNAYSAASRLGILDKVCAHMTPQHITWTDEMLFDAAAEFNTRNEFKKGNENAYASARNRGVLDQICFHMEQGVNGFDQRGHGQVYVVGLESPVQSYIGFGISNDYKQRIKVHARNANLNGFSLSILNVLDFKIGKDAYDLELKLKRNLPIVNTGVDGFRTEAILASDYDKLKEIINAN